MLLDAKLPQAFWAEAVRKRGKNRNLITTKATTMHPGDLAEKEGQRTVHLTIHQEPTSFNEARSSPEKRPMEPSYGQGDGVT